MKLALAILCSLLLAGGAAVCGASGAAVGLRRASPRLLPAWRYALLRCKIGA